MFTDDDMDAVFHALAHATRRQILDRVRHEPGITVGALAQGFDVSRIAIMNHLSVLESAGLIVSKKEGRTRRLFLNAVPIRQIQDRWLDSYGEYWADRTLHIKAAAEAAARTNKDTDE